MQKFSTHHNIYYRAKKKERAVASKINLLLATALSLQYNIKKPLTICKRSNIHGAEGRTRTGTWGATSDFESGASANSATSAYRVRFH